MKTDRELLGLAAKAHGGIIWDGEDPDSMGIDRDGSRYWWRPLEDDGDALRLAVKLQIRIEYWPENDSVLCSLPGSMGAESVEALDDYGARRAIVRAASVLGEHKK